MPEDIVRNLENMVSGIFVYITATTKWFKPSRIYKVGDFVLLKDQDVFHQSWPLAVITEVHPGLDGQVRTVTLRTSKGTYKRPVVKLVLLVPEKDYTSSLCPGEDIQANIAPFES